jgi:hypothetical protein
VGFWCLSLTTKRALGLRESNNSLTVSKMHQLLSKDLKCNESDLDFMLCCLLNEYNRRILQPGDRERERQKGMIVDDEWVITVEQIFFLLDTIGYGFISSDGKQLTLHPCFSLKLRCYSFEIQIATCFNMCPFV